MHSSISQTYIKNIVLNGKSSAYSLGDLRKSEENNI